MSSMLRCAYNRAKIVKCSVNEAGASITLNVSNGRSTQQFLVQLAAVQARHFMSGVVLANSKTSNTLNSENAVKQDGKSENLALFRNNEWIVDTSLLTNGSVSEGYYHHDGFRQRYQAGEKRRKSQHEYRQEYRNNCKFDFGSVRIPLIETGVIGIIGAAVAVGIDYNRTNKFRPSLDFCQKYEQLLNPYSPPAKAISKYDENNHLSRVLELVHQSSANRNCLGPCCGSYLSAIPRSTFCPVFLIRQILNVLGFANCPSATSSITSNFGVDEASTLNVLPRVASSEPNANAVPFDSCRSDEIERDYVDGWDEPLISTYQPQGSFADGGYDSGVDAALTSLEEKFQSKEEVKQTLRRKNAVHFAPFIEQISHSETSFGGKCEPNKSQSSQCFGSGESGFKSGSEPSSPSVASTSSEGSEDIAAVFKMASIEYADQLNNLIGVSLMNGHKPDEAMQCWSSCENSSSAFFNMGVSYESGRHAKKAQPDLDRAHDCYAMAASMGHKDAIYNLALFYLYGKGKVEVNLECAIGLLKIAAAKGVKTADTFCRQIERQQRLEAFDDIIQRNFSQWKQTPLRSSIMRPSPSLNGPRLQPKQHTNDTTGGLMRRNKSDSSLYNRIVIAN